MGSIVLRVTRLAGGRDATNLFDCRIVGLDPFMEEPDNSLGSELPRIDLCLRASMGYAASLLGTPGTSLWDLIVGL
jgi:hypothetical protein